MGPWNMCMAVGAFEKINLRELRSWPFPARGGEGRVVQKGPVPIAPPFLAADAFSFMRGK